MTEKPTAFDLFAGCGGLSLGLQEAGLDVRWANELDPDACQTYRQSHPTTRLIEGDANQTYERLRSREPGWPQPGEVDLLAGGPPCQGFSGYNRHRQASDPRNSLMETFLDFVDYLKPRYVLIENVAGLLSLSEGQVVSTLLDTLSLLGYRTRLGILQAGYYGLPQNRWRVFIWGAIAGRTVPEFPSPTHLFPRTTIFGATKFRRSVVQHLSVDRNLFHTPLPTVTVADAINDLPEIANGGGADEMDYGSAASSEYQRRLRGTQVSLLDHRTARLTGIQLQRCQAMPKKKGSGWTDLPPELRPNNLARHGDSRYSNRFGRLHWSGTFNTILSRPHPYWGTVFHPSQDRLISVRESARAQGFPDRVRFYGKVSSRYRQVGNAVPPPMAAAIATELVRVTLSAAG